MTLLRLAFSVSLLLLPVCFVPPLSAEELQGKIVLDQWLEIHTKEGKLGYQHLQAREIEQKGVKLIRSVFYEETTILALDKPFKEKTWHETLENQNGKVVEVGYRLNLSKEQVLKVVGTIAGKKLTLRVIGDDGKPTRFSQKVPWDEDVLGLYALEVYFRDKKFKSKDVFEAKSFDFTMHRALPTTWKIDESRDNLLKVQQSHPRSFNMGESAFWLDGSRTIVKHEVDHFDWGVITYAIADREKASAPFKPKIKEKEGSIPVNKSLKIGPRSPSELVLRVQAEGEENHGTLFATDGRQKMVKADKTGVELKLLASAPQVKPDKIAPAAQEYLEENFYIRSEDPLVVKLAKKAVGKAEKPLAKVKAIGRWIDANIDYSYEINHASADEVARIMKGDCTECSVLAAAMCRAQGIPARIAVGLVYNPDNPGFDCHQWVEVYIDGQWQPFDPSGTLEEVQAAYIKIADYSMKDLINPFGLIEFNRVASGQVKVEVLESK